MLMRAAAVLPLRVADAQRMVGVIQAMLKLPFLLLLIPQQSEPPFVSGSSMTCGPAHVSQCVN
jgi:hypothetical protein